MRTPCVYDYYRTQDMTWQEWSRNIRAEGLEKRLPFRRVLKQTLEKVLASKEVKGAKIKLSGRLGGAEMARREDLKKGQIPLQTLRAARNNSVRARAVSAMQVQAETMAVDIEERHDAM